MWLSNKNKHKTQKRKDKTMNKKFIVVLATGTLLVTSIAGAAGCTKKAVKAEPTVEVQALIADPAELMTDGAELLLTAHVQNPAIHFIGGYYNEKATLLVEANGDENATLTVVLAKSDKSKTTLTVDAKFDASTNTVSYENATKKELTLDENGDVVSEKEIYTDGTGKFVFGTEEAVWDDNNEKIANMIFTFGIPDEHLEIEQDVAKKVTKAATKTTKKAAKKAAKPAKKAKKTKKPTTKPSKTPETTTDKYTYGKSVYSYSSYTIYVNINKDNTASVRVVHAESRGDYKVQYLFDFSGKINPKTGFMTYSNGSKETIVEGTHVRQARMEYLNSGKGYMTFNGNTLTWFDGVDHFADGFTFRK